MLWWHYLAIAIVGEVIATTSLKLSDGFTRPWPMIVMVISFLIAFYALSIVMRTTSLGLIYAIWSGVGVIMITLVGKFIFGHNIDLAGAIGIVLIIAGVIVLGVFSGTLEQG
jgi:small multidrug resistance pump